MKTTKDGRRCARSILKRIMISALFLFFAGGILMIFCLFGRCGLFGYQARIIMSSSMETQADETSAIREIPAGSLILIRLVPKGDKARDKFYSDLKTGDVLTFSYKIVGESAVITHRIENIEKQDGGYTLVLSSDSGTNAGKQTIHTSDTASSNRVIGKVIAKSHFLGVLFCTLKSPLSLVVFCMIVLAAMFMEALNSLYKPKSLRAEGTMKNRIIVIVIVVVVALVLFCFALAIGVTYGLYDETMSTQTHLVAGSLKATLERVKLTTYNVDGSGNFTTIVDDKVKDFSTNTEDCIFGINTGTVAVPGSTFTAEMRITNHGDVTFYYYVETFYNALVSDQTFASMLELTISSKLGTWREVRLSDGLTVGDEDEPIGSVDVGEAETFTVTLKFQDEKGNNNVENKFVLFDICIHAVQKINAA